MPPDCILSIDQGTTASRAVVVGPDGAVVCEHRCPLPQHYPQPGWVEHDLEEVWRTVTEAVAGAIGAAPGGWGRIAAVGITNQRETVGIWERGSGRPVAPAIVWQCRRTAEMCARVREEHGPRIAELTGLTVDPYFSASKLAWLLDSIPGVRARAHELAAGTIDTWLVWRLTGGEHLTDPTNASRTMLFDIRRREWSEELTALFDVPARMLPQVRPSGGEFGTTAAGDGIPAGIPIRAVMGDQQAALLGHGCVEDGQAKNTYGTGCFLLVNTGARRPRSRYGLLTTIACDASGAACHALEGSVFIAGAAVQWLRDGLGIISEAGQVEGLARSVPDTAGVQFVPAFVGLGAPYWDAAARGALLGLTRGATKAHIARAALEAIAHQSADVMEAMEKDGAPVGELKVDGGAAANDLLMQMQADLANVVVVRPGEREMTALGAAYLAGMGADLWEQPWAGAQTRADRFAPALPPPDRAAAREAWRQAVARVRGG